MTNNMRRHPLLTLPQELQDIIFSYFGKHYIHTPCNSANIYATCRSLNRDWHAHFTPLFWKHLSTTKFATLESLMTQPELREALSTNAHLIKHLKTTRLDVLEFFVHSPPSPPRRPSNSSPATATPTLSTNGKQVTELETPPTYDFNCGTTEAPIQLTEFTLRFDQFRSSPIKTAGFGGSICTTTEPSSPSPTGDRFARSFGAATGDGSTDFGSGFGYSSTGYGTTTSSGFGTGSWPGVLGNKDTTALPQTPLFSVHDNPVSQWHLYHFKGCPLVPREDQLLIRFMHQNRTSLTVLHLEDLIFWDCNYLLVCLTAEHLPQLQKLKIKWVVDGDGLCNMVLKQFLEGCSETIQELMIHFATLTRFGIGPHRFSSPQLDIQSPPKPHPELKTVVIDDMRKDGNRINNDYALADFLRGCNGKRLQNLILPGTIHFTPKTMALLHEIGFIETFLVTKLHRLQDISDAELAQVIDLNPHWKHVDLEATNNFGPVSERIIIQHCERFTHLMINNCQPRFSSSGILTVLRQASRLEQLCATTDRAWGYIPHDPVLDAKDIVSCTVPWQCAQTLQILELEIAHVPRPDIVVGHYHQSLEAHPDHMGTMEESRATQRRIYRRLGQLTQLQELCLGWTLLLPHWTYRDFNGNGEVGQGPRQVIDRSFQLACLEMNLASGLEELAEMKELTVLDVSRMAHRIDISSLEWMQCQWPKLKHIYGLYHPGFEGQPGVQAWVELHQPQWHARSPPESKAGA
ncbi:hypothetical protein BGZ81_010328 [Podila clonocystis]|nr:hypothetical protein BGZ81_010328 [Podila clonocystis]